MNNFLKKITLTATLLAAVCALAVPAARAADEAAGGQATIKPGHKVRAVADGKKNRHAKKTRKAKKARKGARKAKRAKPAKPSA